MTTFAVYLALELDINPMATALYAKLEPMLAVRPLFP